jgi:hypothetical protein
MGSPNVYVYLKMIEEVQMSGYLLYYSFSVFVVNQPRERLHQQHNDFVFGATNTHAYRKHQQKIIL